MNIPATASGLFAVFFAVSAFAQSPLASPTIRPPAPAVAGAQVQRVARASITSYVGYIEIERKATGAREAVARAPAAMAPGDKVHTGRGGRATVQFRDGSQVMLGPFAIFTVEAETPRETTIFLEAGKLWAAVNKNARRRFSVRTPTAVAAVRGTEFSVEVRSERATAVEVFGGQVAVRGALGAESMVSASQRVDVTDGRMGQVERFTPRPESVPEAIRPAILAPAESGDADGEGKPAEDERGAQNGPKDGPREAQERGPEDGPGEGGREFAFDPERFKEFIEHQAGEQVMRDQRESSAIFEHKSELLQDGKTLIDAFGRRVRVEEYILRPSADSFKFVSFNLRADRVDLASVEVTANRSLPEDLADAGNLWFSDGAPDYWAVKQRLTMTNGRDSVVDLGVDGAPQLFTAAAGPVFDPNTNAFVNSPGFSFYATMFGNKYEFINGDRAGVDRIWSDAGFRPVNNGLLSGTNVAGMMWRTQPVKVNITNLTLSRGVYWTDAFVKYDASNGLAFAQTTFQPDPRAAHFVSYRSYFNFSDTNANGLLDFGEQLEPGAPTFFHDVVSRMNGTSLVAVAGTGTRQAAGDTVVFSDFNGTGAAAGNPQAAVNYASAVRPMEQAVDFAHNNPRAWVLADEIAVDDFGSVLRTGRDYDDSTSLFFEANFERRVRSSEFAGRDIDVVMSPAFIFQSGAADASYLDRAVPSPGPGY